VTTSPTYTAALATPPSGGGRTRRIAEAVTRWSLPLLLVVIVVVATATTPGFLSFDNLIGISAVGMTAVTMSGNLVSLAVSQQAMLASIIFIASVAGGLPVLVAFLVTVIALVAISALQGVFIAAGLNPMITTLAGGAVIFGLATVATGGTVVSAPTGDFRWIALSSPLGLPLPIYVFIVFTILATLLIDKTVVGRKVLLAGANRETARLSGVSFRIATLAAFVLLGVGTAISGVVVAAQAGQATTLDLATLTSNVIAAVLVGGTAIQGGFGSPLRSALGALMIAIFTNVMVLHNFEHGWRMFAVGALVVVMVSVLHVLRKKAI
jgi:ribose/xylose/arabinose/galactoside ABC-type transport system permease subunit